MRNGILILAALLLVSCGPDKFVKKGNEAFYIGEYYEASLQYAKAYAKIPASEKEKRGEIAYKIGESNRLCNYSIKALAGYRNAARFKYTDTLTYYYLAEMERIGKDYKNAALHYEEFLKTNPGDKPAIIGLQSCAAAPEWKAQGSSYTVHEDKVFNSRFDDFSPVLMGDRIFLSSTRRESEGDEISGITGMKYGDIFFAAKDEKGKWKKMESVGSGVNTQYDEGACCFSPNGSVMYFTRCRWDANYPRLAEIYKSARSDASWGEAQQCVLSHDTLTTYAHPAVSPDGLYLYFVSDMPGGQGGMDIWRAEILGEGFGLLENLGPEINTPGDEMFPTFRPNGELYFSSNGRVGMGGLDLYKAVPDTSANRYWRVEHLPSPVNSNGDDFGMTFDGVHNRGYFCSNRTNRRGWDKIYTFECPEIIQSVKGWVYEQDGYELPKAIVYMVGDDGTNEKLSVKLDGSFDVQVRPNVNYLFLATCEGYMNYNQMLHVGTVKESHEDTLQFPLPSAKIPVLVHNVFYEFNKANITPESEPALNALVNLLKQNPAIAIELSAHCDYRGSQEYNVKLSQHRADAVVNYLISKGIPKDRVVPKGYGKLKPKIITGKFAERYPFLKAGDELTEDFIKKLTPGQQDTCNALNRRTEFSVIQTTYGLLDKDGNLDTNNLIKQNAEKKAAVKEIREARQMATQDTVRASVQDKKAVPLQKDTISQPAVKSKEEVKKEMTERRAMLKEKIQKVKDRKANP